MISLLLHKSKVKPSLLCYLEYPGQYLDHAYLLKQIISQALADIKDTVLDTIQPHPIAPVASHMYSYIHASCKLLYKTIQLCSSYIHQYAFKEASWVPLLIHTLLTQVMYTQLYTTYTWYDIGWLSHVSDLNFIVQLHAAKLSLLTAGVNQCVTYIVMHAFIMYYYNCNCKQHNVRTGYYYYCCFTIQHIVHIQYSIGQLKS